MSFFWVSNGRQYSTIQTMTVSPAEIDRGHVTMGTCSGCAVLLGGTFVGSVLPVPSTVVPSV